MRRLLFVALLACLAMPSHGVIVIRTPPASGQTLYWIGGAGNTNDGANWSTSSGGGACTCTPGASDTAIVDGSSGTGTYAITLDAALSITEFDVQANSTDAVTFAMGTNDLTTTGDVTFGDADGAVTASAGADLSVGGSLDTSEITFSVSALNIDMTGTGNWDYSLAGSDRVVIDELTACASGQTTTLRMSGATQIGVDIDLNQLNMGGGTCTASRALASDTNWATTLEFQDTFSSNPTPITGTGTLSIEQVEFSPEFGSDITMETDITWALTDPSSALGADSIRFRGNSGVACNNASAPDITFDGSWDSSTDVQTDFGNDIAFTGSQGWTADGIVLGGNPGCTTVSFSTGGFTVSNTLQLGSDTTDRIAQVTLGTGSSTVGILNTQSLDTSTSSINGSAGADITSTACSGIPTCSDIIYIDPGATGAADGTSCTDAYTDWSNVEGHLLTDNDCVYLCSGIDLSLGTGDDLTGATNVAGTIRTDTAGSPTRATLSMNGEFIMEVASAGNGVNLCDVVMSW